MRWRHEPCLLLKNPLTENTGDSPEGLGGVLGRAAAKDAPRAGSTLEVRLGNLTDRHYICVVGCRLSVDWLVGCNAVLATLFLGPLKMLKSPKLKCHQTWNVTITEISPKHNWHLIGIHYDEDNDDDEDDDDDVDDDEGFFSKTKTKNFRRIIPEALLEWWEVFHSFCSTSSGYWKSRPLAVRQDLNRRAAHIHRQSYI